MHLLTSDGRESPGGAPPPAGSLGKCISTQAWHPSVDGAIVRFRRAPRNEARASASSHSARFS